MKLSKLYKIICSVPFLNLALVLISNILSFWTWINVFNSDNDTMFLELFLIPLFFVTVYYLILLIWGLRLFMNSFSLANSAKFQNLTLFFLLIIPMILIFILTT